MAALSAFSKYNSSRAVDLCRQQMEGMRTCCLPLFHLELLWYQPCLHISGLWTSWYVLGRTGWCTAWAAFQWCHNGLPPQAHRAPKTMSPCCTWAERATWSRKHSYMWTGMSWKKCWSRRGKTWETRNGYLQKHQRSHLIPHALLDIGLNPCIACHLYKTGLPLVKVVQRCCYVHCSSPESGGCQAGEQWQW